MIMESVFQIDRAYPHRLIDVDSIDPFRLQSCQPLCLGRYFCVLRMRRVIHPHTCHRGANVLEGSTLANSKSSRKRIRTSERNRIANRTYRSSSRTLLKRAEMSIAAGDQDAATEAVQMATSMLDRAQSKKVIHRNNAARRKSRLMAKYHAAFSA